MDYFFVILGLVFIVFGVIGFFILNDTLLRLHASTKCGITGSVSILIGLMIYEKKIDFNIKILLIILFIFITAPLTAHIFAYTYYQYRNKISENKKDQS